MELKTILENIEWGLHLAPDCITLREAKQSLASLESMLEGDAGEDEKIIGEYIRISERHCLGQGYDENVPCSYAEILNALFRLSAKAKIGEAEIAKAKREVLERIGNGLAHNAYNVEGLGARCYPGCKKCVILEELAALKEAGKNETGTIPKT